MAASGWRRATRRSSPRLTAAAVARGFARIVAAGGETSGAVAGALGKVAFAIGPEIDPGVPALATAGEPRLALALKSGNFGGDDFLARALARAGGQGVTGEERALRDEICRLARVDLRARADGGLVGQPLGAAAGRRS